MAFRTRISKVRQYEEAIEVNGVVIAVHADSAVELLIEAGGLPISRIPRPDNMKGRPVRVFNNGSTPNAGALGDSHGH